jgi:hypothetical protein
MFARVLGSCCSDQVIFLAWPSPRTEKANEMQFARRRVKKEDE